LQNFPNPFNPTTTIHYSLPQALNYTLTIRDIQGREVIRLAETSMGPGNYSMQWSGRDAGGRSVDSGIYFCSLKGGAQSQTIKMVYLR
ncbi:MAG: T9SS type A sorting domain-containing protein, partial [Candidatus Marinimicrobia bacterium]|nr:T9SS type A sorting domain-containing protein [Candidatus Neomarinimicrobiota bacterium]